MKREIIRVKPGQPREVSYRVCPDDCPQDCAECPYEGDDYPQYSGLLEDDG